jgi:hypothetical protein
MKICLDVSLAGDDDMLMRSMRIEGTTVHAAFDRLTSVIEAAVRQYAWDVAVLRDRLGERAA